MARFSIIVPLHRLTPSSTRCLQAVLEILGSDDEFIVVSDSPVDGLPSRVRHVLTGSTSDSSPALKRDRALASARGEICAFLDDDAYPAGDWLEKAMQRFAVDPTIAAIGGPGLTPDESPWRERVGGAFYESRMGSGSLRNRFRPEGAVRDVDDWPAYNFFVRTSVLRSVGGWASDFYGGEDTKLCLSLVAAGHRIVYDPDVRVFHHRRPVLSSHVRQLANVGLHRGYFARRYPQTSARAQYFAPSIGLAGGAAILAWGLTSPARFRRVARAASATYGAMTAVALREGANPSVAIALPAVVAITHCSYGASFIRGLLTRNLDR